MEAWLWESYSTDRPWIELECAYSADRSNTLVRYQRGRTALMTLTNMRSDVLGQYMMFGRSILHPAPASYQCDIRLESLVIEGPGGLPGDGAEVIGDWAGFELADTFLVRDTDTGQSCRVWRQENVTWRSAHADGGWGPGESAGGHASGRGRGGTQRSCCSSGAAAGDTGPGDGDAGGDGPGRTCGGAAIWSGRWDAGAAAGDVGGRAGADGGAETRFCARRTCDRGTRGTRRGGSEARGRAVLGTPDGTWSHAAGGHGGEPGPLLHTGVPRGGGPLEL